MHLNITGDRLTREFREGTESPPGARRKNSNDCLWNDQYSENVRKKNQRHNLHAALSSENSHNTETLKIRVFTKSPL